MTELEKDKKRQFWWSHIDAWQISKMTRSEYCKRNGINYYVFQYWMKQRKAKIQKPLPVIQIAERLELQSIFRFPHSPATSPMNLWLGEYRIEVCQGFCPQTLTQLVRTLRGI